MLSNQPQVFIGCEASFENADIVLFGAPYDSTTSYRPGARFGPKAIRSESFGIETYSPYLHRDLLDYFIMDSGDLELPFGTSEMALSMIEERARIIASEGKKPVLLGGEHLVTLGAVRALAKRYPDLCIVHLDAHADLRQDYLGNQLSHACVIRRCWDLLGDKRIYQLGIRSGDREEFTFAEEGHVTMHPFSLHMASAVVKALVGKPVYLTIDLDVLDPSAFPGTGTPEAGGVSYMDLFSAIVTMTTGGMRIVGCDLVELAPSLDASGISTATACKLLRDLLLLLGMEP